MSRRLIIAIAVLTPIVVGIGGSVFLAIDRAADRAIESRSGPVHRFPLAAGRASLTDQDAARLARDVMNRDGLPEPAWWMEVDDRPKAPDDRSDRFFAVAFWCDDSPTPRRFVHIEVRNGEVVARGVFGK
jgi:hypothetical protein